MLKKTEKEILTEARDLIVKGWTQGTYARDCQGDSCYVHSPHATCFCVLGAIRRVSSGRQVALLQKVATHIEDPGAICVSPGKPLGTWLPAFNDHCSTKQADVVQLLNKAIDAV